MPGDGSAAMAALSALLRGLQAADRTTSSSAVVSPQGSEGVEVSVPSAGALPRGPTAEKRSDPLEQAEEEEQAEQAGQAGQAEQEQEGQAEQADDESLDVEALLPEDAAGGTGGRWDVLAAAGPDPATPLGLSAAAGEGATIAAQWQQQGSSTASARAGSRIPLPPPAGSGCAKPSPLVCSKREPVSSGAKASPAAKGSVMHGKLTASPHAGSTSPGKGIKALFGCVSPRPGATLSSTQL